MARRDQNRRPPWPFVLNQDSEQARGLVAWLPLGSAGGWYDFSRYKRDFANVGTTLYDDPVLGRVRDFSGTNQYVRAASSPVTVPPMSLCCWGDSDSDSADQILLSVQAAGTAGFLNSVMLQMAGAAVGDPVRIISGDASASSSAATTTGYTVGTWHHCCGVTAAVDSRAAYIDGGSKGTQTTSRTPTGIDQANVGVRADLGLDFNGRIADARIYNRALTDDEVYRLWHPLTRWNLYYQLGRRKTFIPLGLSRADATGIVISGGGSTIIRGAA